MGIISGNIFKHSVRLRHLLAYDILGLATLWLSRQRQPGFSDHLHLYGDINLSILPMEAHVQLDCIKAKRTRTFKDLLNKQGHKQSGQSRNC